MEVDQQDERDRVGDVVQFVDSPTAGRAATVPSPERFAGSAEPAAQPPPSTDQRSTPQRSEGGQPVWRVRCGDLINRERCVTVFVENNEVVLVGPPGESARLTARQVGQLNAALNEAAKLTER